MTTDVVDEDENSVVIEDNDNDPLVDWMLNEE
jgi:hypothetical protein